MAVRHETYALVGSEGLKSPVGNVSTKPDIFNRSANRLSFGREELEGEVIAIFGERCNFVRDFLHGMRCDLQGDTAMGIDERREEISVIVVGLCGWFAVKGTRNTT